VTCTSSLRYNQNLDLHNGIHAAIRGKLLEATFASVWVEPLKSAVLGYGHGGEGATSAQTFALSRGNLHRYDDTQLLELSQSPVSNLMAWNK
jgi:hypothetical protein